MEERRKHHVVLRGLLFLCLPAVSLRVFLCRNGRRSVSAGDTFGFCFAAGVRRNGGDSVKKIVSLLVLAALVLILLPGCSGGGEKSGGEGKNTYLIYWPAAAGREDGSALLISSENARLFLP